MWHSLSMGTIVFQSHSREVQQSWIERCTDSVKAWAASQGFAYQWLDDDLFALLPAELFAKVSEQRPVAADLARLRLLEKGLLNHEYAVWIDADVLILRPNDWRIGALSHGFGREVWVQQAKKQLKVYRKVHNAVLQFQQRDPVLAFYRHCAEKIVEEHREQPMAPQIVGPKLLTALHNIVGFNVIESAGMLPPLVARDLMNGQGQALAAFVKATTVTPLALNLCSSLATEHAQLGVDMQRLVDRLQDQNHWPPVAAPGTSQN